MGDVDGTSASPDLIEIALKNLRSSTYSVNHNHPFKGGTITRHYGKPSEHQHALQLEMTKLNYMDDREIEFNEERAGKMRTLLQKTLGNLINQLV